MKNYFDNHDLTIAAGKSSTIYGYNNFITLLECSESGGVRVGIGQHATGKLLKGLSVELPQGESFDYLTFYNDTANTMTLTVMLSIGRVYDNRLVLTGTDPLSVIQVQLQGNTAAGSYGQAIVGTPTAKILNANAGRVGFSIQAKNSNTGNVYLGFTNGVTDLNWFVQLQAGMSLNLDNYRGEIWAIADVTAQYVGWGEW